MAADAGITTVRVRYDAPPVPVLIALIGASALPLLAIDMYLPSMPRISAAFNAPVGTQMSLTVLLLMLGLGQILAGPLTDAVGRRRPLLFGLAVFVAGSVLAALAPGIVVLLAARFMQGLGGSLAVVVANSSVRDYTSGDEATKLYALLMGVVAIAPVIAPTVGGFLDSTLGWRAIFWTLAIMGVLLIGMIMTTVPESLAPQRRAPLDLRTVFGMYLHFVRDPRFAMPAVALSSMCALLFAYIGGASHVYQLNFGLDTDTVGLAFGATGAAILTGTLTVNRLAARVRSATLALLGGALATIGAAGSIISLLADAPFEALLGAMLILAVGVGMSEPALMGQAMTASDIGTGQAAAILGAIQSFVGAIAVAIAGIVATSGALSWAILLASFAALSAGLMVVGMRQPGTAATAPESAPAVSPCPAAAGTSPRPGSDRRRRGAARSRTAR